MDRMTNIMICGGLVLLFYTTVLSLIFCDLWAGVRKAKKRKEYRTSEGYKRTISKIAKYYNMLLALTAVDIVQISLLFYLHIGYGYDIPMVPWFTLVGTIYIAFVELKSIEEPANLKELKQQEDFKRMMVSLAKDYGHPEEMVIDIINAMNSDQKQQLMGKIQQQAQAAQAGSSAQE